MAPSTTYHLFLELSQWAILVFVVGPVILVAGFFALIVDVLRGGIKQSQKEVHRPPPPRSILITGSSSGIGKSLAVEYAKKIPGVFIALHGRDKTRLEDVKRECEAHGATVTYGIVDVTDAEGMRRWISEVDTDEHPLDLVIANAGVSENVLAETDYARAVRGVFDININGVVNTVMPAAQRMMDRKLRRGQIVIMSSIASWAPDRGVYSASKVCVRYLGEVLRQELGPHGIRVNVVAPGYVDTPLTKKNKFAMPMMMDPETSSKIVMDALERDVPVIAYPFAMATLTWLYSIVPHLIRKRLHLSNLVSKRPAVATTSITSTSTSKTD